MTPRLLTCGEGETEELSIEREKLSALDSVDLVPMRRISVLSLFNFKKFEVNQDFISDRQLVREEGGSAEFGLVDR